MLLKLPGRLKQINALPVLLETLCSLLGVLLLSLLGGWLKHIPPALGWQQAIIVLLAAAVLPLPGLKIESLTTERLWRAALSALVSYGGFMFYFVRHYFSPRYMDPANPITMRATAIAMCTLIACLAVPLLASRPKDRRRSWPRLAAATVTLLLIVYLPPLQHASASRGLTILDWLCVAVTALFYLALYLLQRKSAEHSRQAVLKPLS